MLNDGEKKQSKIESYMDACDDITREQDHDYVSQLITKHFSHELFNIVQDFLLKKSTEEIYHDDIVSDRDEDEEDEEDDYYSELEEEEDEQIQQNNRKTDT